MSGRFVGMTASRASRRVIPLVPCHPEAEMGMNGNGNAAGLLMKFLTSSEISSNLAWHLVASNEELLDSKGVGKESVLWSVRSWR